MASIWIAHQFPLLNYLGKENAYKFHVAAIQADHAIAGNAMMFPINDSDKIFSYSYLFDDVKNAVKDPLTKVIFINNTPAIFDRKDRCLIGSLEYYFLDPEFRKNFLKNFRFENHVIITRSANPLKKNHLFTKEKPDIFDQVEPSKQRIVHDFEVYTQAI